MDPRRAIELYYRQQTSSKVRGNVMEYDEDVFDDYYDKEYSGLLDEE